MLFEKYRWLPRLISPTQIIKALRSTRLWFRALLSIGVVSSSFMVLLVISSAAEKGPAFKALGPLLGLIAVVSLFANVLLGWPRTENGKFDLTAAAQTKVPPVLILALHAAFGTLVDVASLFAPQAAVESSPRRIEVLAESSNAILRTQYGGLGTDAPILVKISGLWGELDNCEVAYRFGIRGKALEIVADRLPDGEGGWRLVSTIERVNGHTMVAVAESPASARGAAATFTIRVVGEAEILEWDDRSKGASVKLQRCG